MTVEPMTARTRSVTRRLLPRVPRCIPLAARLAPGTNWSPGRILRLPGASRRALSCGDWPGLTVDAVLGPVISHEGTP